MTSIQTQSLRKCYGQVVAVDDLTLKIEEGTVFGFLGPNGAGKSTTIRLLTGLAHPTSGQAWVAGIPISHFEKVAARIGYLPEEPAFYNWMTPTEFIDYIGRLFAIKLPERTKRTRELLEKVGLSDVAKRRVGGFSRGMRQRLGLAQALVNHPDVLFLDEPVSALDPLGRREILDLILQLRSQTTVFMSTHILADVERVCDTVGIIQQGHLLIEARQEELLATYTIPAFEVECDPNAEELFKAWCEKAKTIEGVVSLTTSGPVTRIVVKDIPTSRQALISLAAQSNLPLRRFELVTPSLEDIFIKLVNGKEVLP